MKEFFRKVLILLLLSSLIVGNIFVSSAFAAPPIKKDYEAAIKDIATGVSVIAGTAALIPHPAATVGAAAGGIAQGLTFIGIGIWHLFTFARLPENQDPSHGEYATVDPVIFTSVSGPEPLATDANAFLVAAGHVIDESRLINMSLRKYYGAVNDGNENDATMQRVAASQHLYALQAAISVYRSSLLKISSDIQGTPFAAISVTVPDVLALRDQIVAAGFPSFELSLFSQMHATPEEIAGAIMEVASVNGATITDSDLTGAVIFDRTAAALGQANIMEYLPEGFTPVPANAVPTLSEWGLIIFGFALLTVGVFYLRRRRMLLRG